MTRYRKCGGSSESQGVGGEGASPERATGLVTCRKVEASHPRGGSRGRAAGRVRGAAGPSDRKTAICPKIRDLVTRGAGARVELPRSFGLVPRDGRESTGSAPKSQGSSNKEHSCARRSSRVFVFPNLTRQLLPVKANRRINVKDSPKGKSKQQIIGGLEYD